MGTNLAIGVGEADLLFNLCVMVLASVVLPTEVSVPGENSLCSRQSAM